MPTKPLTAFVRQYLETALWSSTDDNGEPLDRDYSIEDIAPDALAAMQADCEQFRVQHAELVEQAEEHNTEENIAHDFWLTRNGHGAGFWDGDYPEELGNALTAAAEAFGNCDLYVGDDGKVHCFPGRG